MMRYSTARYIHAETDDQGDTYVERCIQHMSFHISLTMEFSNQKAEERRVERYTDYTE